MLFTSVTVTPGGVSSTGAPKVTKVLSRTVVPVAPASTCSRPVGSGDSKRSALKVLSDEPLVSQAHWWAW